MQGTIRSYDKDTLAIIKKRIRTIAESTAAAMECKCEVDISDLYPAVINHEKETQHVKRIAAEFLGS